MTLERDTGSLFLQIWENQAVGEKKWYQAVFNLNSDGSFEFSPSYEDEKSFTEVYNLEHAP